jgi:phosphatidylinositol glycan class V
MAVTGGLMTQFQYQNPFLTLTVVFITVKVIHLSIIYLTPTTFDLSSTIHVPYITSYPAISLVLQKLRHWDAVYFAHLFNDGPQYDHEWVFSPFWWRLIHYIPDTVFSRYVNAIIITNLSQLFSSFILYKYTLLKFTDNAGKISLRSSVLFLTSTIGIFGTAPYSENFNTLVTFIGLYILEISRLEDNAFIYVTSSVFFEIAFWTRSNSILLGFIYFYDLITKLQKRALVSGILFGVGILYYNYLPYVEFCTGGSTRPWCHNKIPSLFSYAQSKYWDNGFLKYWTPNNIPNFLIAAPQVFLLSRSGLYFMKFKNLTNLVVINFLFLIIVTFFLNVQIILRISTFIPLQFWFLSSLIEKRQGSLWITYIIVWNLLQASLYAAFLPPA